MQLGKLTKTGAEQSTMQIRVYDKKGNFITGYAQCYGNLNFCNILKKQNFVHFEKFQNNVNLKFSDELSLFTIPDETKIKIMSESKEKNIIVVYWNIWSNHFSKIMLKKTSKYIKKFDPDMINTFVVLANND